MNGTKIKRMPKAKKPSDEGMTFAEAANWVQQILKTSDTSLPPLREEASTVARPRPSRWHIITPSEPTGDVAGGIGEAAVVQESEIDPAATGCPPILVSSPAEAAAGDSATTAPSEVASPSEEMPADYLEPSEGPTGRSLDDNAARVRKLQPEDIFERRRRERAERMNPKSATPAVAVAKPSAAAKNAIALIRQLEAAPTSQTAEEREGLIGAVLGALLTDSRCSLDAVCQMVDRLFALAPAEFAGATTKAVHRGLLYQMMVNPSDVSAVQRLVAILRPALIFEYGLKDIGQVAELDAGLAALSEFARFSCAAKLESTMGRVLDGKSGVSHARMSAAAQTSMKHFQSVLESLKNRRQRSIRTLQVHAAGTVNMLINDVSNPLKNPTADAAEEPHGKS